ncbi:MAG: hypothetical protein QM764_09435 [Chitinophagaceae bacterium]
MLSQFKRFGRAMQPILLLSALLCALLTTAQDSTKKRHSIKELAKDVYHSFIVVQNRQNDSVFFQKSEQSYQEYAGKIVRRTIVQKLPFGRNVLDTSTQIIGAISRIANNLQTGTKPFIVKQFLFVQPGETVDPYRLADNERLFRELDFIKDSRIKVVPVPDSPDSVDVYIIVRDVFSIGGKVDASGLSDQSITLYDANLFGRAQRLDYTLLFDKNRRPKFGSDILFRKYNMWGTFINLDAAYTTINKGVSLGNENETSAYIKLERPLYTPSAKMAGGLNLSWNESANRYRRPDSLFLDYKYFLQDFWVGYNFGTPDAADYKNRKIDSRRRSFVAVRYYDQNFVRTPYSPFYNYLYTNKRFVLGEYSWYKLNFYRTNYIYGFGITEDIPIGFSRKIIAGYSQIDSLKRLYLGWQYDHWLVDGNENFYNYTVAVGSNYYHGRLQDNSLLFNLSWFSHLFSFTKFRLRQYANVSYAGIANLRAYDKLYLNNEYGLDHFNTDSAYGTQRMTVGMETDIFTRWKLLGFKIGLFTYGKLSVLSKQKESLINGTLFSSVGGGFRMRNENLIFGTIECRFNWFPRTLENVDNIKVTLSGNIRFKFPESFVQAPWFALLK